MSAPSEGTLRAVSTFVAAFGIGVATYIAIAESGGGAPACIAGGGGCETVAESSYAHLAGINVAVLGIVGYVAAAGDIGPSRRPRPDRGVRALADRLRVQRLPDLPRAFRDRRDLPVVRDQRDPDDDPVRAQHGPDAQLHREGTMSAKKDREKRREERIAKPGRGRRGRTPPAADQARQRRRLPRDRRRRRARRRQPEPDERWRHLARERRRSRTQPRQHPAGRPHARRFDREGDPC